MKTSGKVCVLLVTPRTNCDFPSSDCLVSLNDKYFASCEVGTGFVSYILVCVYIYIHIYIQVSFFSHYSALQYSPS
jgi:hypothetical protein